MKNIVFEINGTGTHNRGAELMAIAVSEQVRARYSNPTIVVSSRFGTPADLNRYGFRATWEALGRFGRLKTFARGLAWRFDANKANPASVDVVLDASGFAFSDQWGAQPAELLLTKMSRPYRKRQDLYLLPQALGTFEKESVRSAVKALFARATQVFARDSKSLESARLIGSSTEVRQCPDFTVLVGPVADASIIVPDQFVGIVPNIRMLDKTKSGESYLGFLRAAISQVRQSDLTPAFVLHDAEEDRKVIAMLGADHAAIPVLTHHDPRVLKWLLGKASIVIGSRFHALVSALSQGTPCIGAGWSHKYPELFSDFNCSDYLVDDLDDHAKLDQCIQALSTTEGRSEASARITEAANGVKSSAEAMWSLVFTQIEERRKTLLKAQAG